ncbi:hypothetical protein NDU88_000359 [Pleurodeles waltl]|uniref:Uncharacterized protein n=1 Tax=Pleurodeles waltl TaxID=8319 RepID=A0AAV7V4W0_PLEWA|nr:hypothetical protein NDU88_000359 [Pleurodeles waltl]
MRQQPTTRLNQKFTVTYATTANNTPESEDHRNLCDNSQQHARIRRSPEPMRQQPTTRQNQKITGTYATTANNTPESEDHPECTPPQ